MQRMGGRVRRIKVRGRYRSRILFWSDGKGGRDALNISFVWNGRMEWYPAQKRSLKAKRAGSRIFLFGRIFSSQNKSNRAEGDGREKDLLGV